MTGNQIRFNEYRETKRHNKVSEIHEHRKVGAEEEKARAATTTAETGRLALSETQRHNIQTERQNWWTTLNTLGETSRHNKVQEGIQQFQADVGKYNALVAEQKMRNEYELGQKQAEINARLAKVSESQLGVSRYNAETARQNVGLGYANLEETQRSHKRSELLDFERNLINRAYNTAMADVAARNASVNEYSAASGKVKDTAALSQAQSAASQARTAARGVSVKEQELQLKKELQPYEKWESATKSLANMGSSAQSFTSAFWTSVNKGVSKRQTFSPLYQTGGAK